MNPIIASRAELQAPNAVAAQGLSRVPPPGHRLRLFRGRARPARLTQPLRSARRVRGSGQWNGRQSAGPGPETQQEDLYRILVTRPQPHRPTRARHLPSSARAPEGGAANRGVGPLIEKGLLDEFDAELCKCRQLVWRSRRAVVRLDTYRLETGATDAVAPAANEEPSALAGSARETTAGAALRGLR